MKVYRLAIGVITFLILVHGPNLFALDPVHKLSPAEKKKTLDFLYSLQNQDGGFVISKNAKGGSNLRATTAACRAIHYFGGEVPHIEKVREFLSSCFHSEVGAFSDQPNGKIDVIVTAVGMLAIVDAKMETKQFKTKGVDYLIKNASEWEQIRMVGAAFEALKEFPAKPIERWVNQLNQDKNQFGGWGTEELQARETGGRVAFFLRLNQSMKEVERIKQLKIITEGQQSDGGWIKEKNKGSDLESCYRVVRALYLMKQLPKSPDQLKQFIHSCRNQDGGYGIQPGLPSTASGTYFAGVISYWLEHLENKTKVENKN